MPNFTTRPEILGTFGVVTTTHWLASAVGMAILEKGGNAFDAAAATGFALQVVEPHLSGPAGDVPMIMSAAGSGEVKVICGQGPSPAAATIQAYRDMGLDMVPGSGLLATVVPGAFDAYMILLRDYGTMSVGEILAPAITYARDGYPLVPNISNTIDAVAELFVNEWPTSAALYMPGGNIPAPGTVFRNPDLADTYARIVRESESAPGNREAKVEAARAVFYKGYIAEAIDGFCRDNEFMDTSGERHRGLLTGADMAGWEATYEPALSYDYHGYTVCKTGPWGQGPTFLQQLALLKGFDLDSMSATDPRFVHAVVESSKLAFADREAFYGDPDFVDVPMDVLLSDDYNDARRALIGENASLEIIPGIIPGHGGKVTVRLKSEGGDMSMGAGEPTVARFDEPAPSSDGQVLGDTCHFDIIDRFGNMIAGTPSGGWLQSSPVIPGLGFCLNSRAQMFWLEEGLPASLAPNRRPRTTLSPSLALRDGEPYMVFGTPGGDQQDQWSLHMFLRHVHFGMNLQESCDAPGFNTAHFPGSFYPRQCDPGHLAVESRFPKATIDDLRRRGHRVEVDEDWCLGRIVGAAKDGEILKAGANPRFMQGYAIGR